MTAGTRHHREFWTQHDDEKQGPVIDPLVALVVTIGLILGLFFIVISLENEPTASAHHTAAATQASPSPMLRLGSTGEPVKSVQSKLNSFGYSIKVDGIFGPQTNGVVRHYQRANGLVVDGIVGPQTLGALNLPATSTQQATRGTSVQITPPPPPPPVASGTGIMGLPFAPEGSSPEAKVRFYAAQFGLPVDWATRISWRESNWRNDVTSSTGCCKGLMQMNFPLHLRDHRIGWRYREACGVNGISDAFGDDPLQWQKHMCAAKQLYDVMGTSPWRL